jgi:hypothetical protein
MFRLPSSTFGLIAFEGLLCIFVTLIGTGAIAVATLI